MRKFHSYGPPNPKVHFTIPRKELIDNAYEQLLGETEEEGGHYITIWAPRQTGKSWVMRETMFLLREREGFDVVKVNLEDMKREQRPEVVMEAIAERIGMSLPLKISSPVRSSIELTRFFSNQVLSKPLILILDEFDALEEEPLHALVGIFRNIYNHRRDEINLISSEKTYLLHAVALIGVRSVLGIENKSGSPFNIQRSVSIPNLNFEETQELFREYEKESGQKIEDSVIDRIFSETSGQPGLVSWFGELLTQTYNQELKKPITLTHFQSVFLDATQVLPNTSVLNLISKANQDPYKDIVLELFQTEEKMQFTFDDTPLNFLYMHGVITFEKDEKEGNRFVKFSNSFIQKRLFYYFSRQISGKIKRVSKPFQSKDDVYAPGGLNIPNLMKRYEDYLRNNREWLLKDAPRRKDLRIYEAVYHFNLFMFLQQFLKTRKGKVFPEFPTGNGKIDGRPSVWSFVSRIVFMGWNLKVSAMNSLIKRHCNRQRIMANN